MIIDIKPYIKPYINVGQHRVNLVDDDCILDNGSCLQFLPNEDVMRDNAKKYVKSCDYEFHKVSRKELTRLLSSYNFVRETRTYVYETNGYSTYPLNAGRFLTEYFFVGGKCR